MDGGGREGGRGEDLGESLDMVLRGEDIGIIVRKMRSGLISGGDETC